VTGNLLNIIESQLPKEHSIRMPRQILVENLQNLKLEDIKFPVVVKTTLACGTTASHQMGIVFNAKGINTFTPPFLVQEFYNHNSTIFKVFVVGDRLHVEKRKSLPNLPTDYEETIYFDSQQPLGPQLEKIKSPHEKTDEELVK